MAFKIPEDQMPTDAQVNAAVPSWQQDGLGIKGTPIRIVDAGGLNFPPATAQNIEPNLPQESPGVSGASVGGGTVNSYNFQIIDASNSSNYGRIQVLAGFLGGVLPTSMYVGDTTPFYLTLSNGLNYILGKLAINSDGTFGAATIYLDTSTFTPDGTYAYILIGTANYNSSTHAITLNTPSAKGSQSLIAAWSPDGTIISGNWSSTGS